MPTSDDVIAFVFELLRQMDFYLDETTADSKFGPAGIDLDSLTVVWLASQIEDTYGVVLSEEDMERLAVMTVGEFADEVVRRTKALPADSASK
jgi:acyl carrier protein